MPEICDWIDNKGGPDNLTLENVFELVDAYLFQQPPPEDCTRHTDQITCEAAGCYWYNNACHSDPQSGTNVIMDNANVPLSGSATSNLRVTDVTNLGSFDGHLYYDPAVVAISSVAAGDLESITPYDDGNGDLSIIAYTSGSLTGNGVLAVITFVPATGAIVNDTCTLTPSFTLLTADPQPQTIPHTSISGTATLAASLWIFIPTLTEVLGVVDYYLGFNGDTLTGCNYYTNCSTYTDQTTCEANGCYWWNGLCHDIAPTCSEIDNSTDCATYGCYWYDGSCHTITPECSSYTDQTTCESNNCYWWNGLCHDIAPTCSEIDNSTDCTTYGCYWYNNACHSDPQTGTNVIMDNVNIPVGGSATSNLRVTDVTNLGSFDGHLYYDPAVVAISSVAAGDLESITPYDDGLGSIYISAYTTGSFTGNGVLAVITFVPASGAIVNDTCILTPSFLLLTADPQPQTIPHTSIPGTATIVNA